MPLRFPFVALVWTAFSLPVAGRAADAVRHHPSSAANAACSQLLEPGDELWMISTRHLGCPPWNNPENPDFQVLQYHPTEGWQDASWQLWLETGPQSVSTVVYVHGNRVDWSKAFRRGTLAYRALRRNTAATEPMRFVIWSWPSNQQCGPRRDAESKADRADLECHYFARYLRSFGPESRLGLIGYSYGARIVSGGLHLVAGGCLDGHTLPEAGDLPPETVRVAMLAGALHNYWWLPGRRHDHCLSQVDQMLVLFNPCDPALRWYAKLDRRNRPRALGAASVTCPHCLGDAGQCLEQRNVACEIGKTHDAEAYFGSASIMSQIADLLLWQDARRP
jgi:hypothetical protein